MSSLCPTDGEEVCVLAVTRRPRRSNRRPSRRDAATRRRGGRGTVGIIVRESVRVCDSWLRQAVCRPQPGICGRPRSNQHVGIAIQRTSQVPGIAPFALSGFQIGCLRDRNLYIHVPLGSADVPRP